MYILTRVFYLSKELLQSVYMNVDCLHHCASSCNHALYKKEGESLHGSTMLFSIVLTVWNISTAMNKLVFTLFQGWTEEMESGNFFQTGLCFAALFSKFTWWWTGKKSLLFCCCFVVAYHFDPIFLAMFCITILKLLISQIIQKSFSHPWEIDR